MQLSRNALVALCVGVIVGVLAMAGLVSAQQKKAPVPAIDAAGFGEPPFQLVDTPGSTYLLNRATGQVWRIGFTEVRGERHWFGTYVPTQDPTTFEEFQQRLRRQLEGN